MRLATKEVDKWYFRSREGSNSFYAVRAASLSVLPGKVTVLMGRSGSGKTTLLEMCAGLLHPDGGSVLLDGEDLYAHGDEDLCRIRREHMAVIPQGADLLPHLTVLENLLLPLSMAGEETSKETEDRAVALLERLDIADLSSVRAKELSGGERRRAAIARGLLGSREVILSDEPTSDLDDVNAKMVLRLLKEEAQRGAGVLLVTHDLEALSFCDALYHMDGGLVTEESAAP